MRVGRDPSPRSFTSWSESHLPLPSFLRVSSSSFGFSHSPASTVPRSGRYGKPRCKTWPRYPLLLPLRTGDTVFSNVSKWHVAFLNSRLMARWRDTPRESLRRRGRERRGYAVIPAIQAREGSIILFKDFKTPPLLGGHYYAELERRRRGTGLNFIDVCLLEICIHFAPPPFSPGSTSFKAVRV